MLSRVAIQCCSRVRGANIVETMVEWYSRSGHGTEDIPCGSLRQRCGHLDPGMDKRWISTKEEVSRRRASSH